MVTALRQGRRGSCEVDEALHQHDRAERRHEARRGQGQPPKDAVRQVDRLRGVVHAPGSGNAVGHHGDSQPQAERGYRRGPERGADAGVVLGTALAIKMMAYVGDDRTDHPLKAPDLSACGLRFEGARLIALHDEVLAQLMYTDRRGQRIALCVTRVGSELSENSESMVEAGVKYHAVGEGRHVFLAAGPGDGPILDQLAATLPALLTRM